MKQNRHKSHILRYITIAAGLCALAAALGWALLRHTPRAYRPIEPADPDEVSPYLTHRLAPDFYNQIQLYEPFELVIEQAGLNDILARGTWPQRYGEVEIFTPVVQFDNGAIYLMSHVKYSRFSSVLTVVARPEMDMQGRLNLNIRSVRLGWVPVTAAARRIAENVLKDVHAELQNGLQLETMVQAVINNSPFDPALDFDKQHIRLDDFKIEPGRLRLRLVPERRRQQ